MRGTRPVALLWPRRPGAGCRCRRQPGLTGRQALVEGPDGLQITKPPYGVIVGIDLNQNGKLIFPGSASAKRRTTSATTRCLRHEHPEDRSGHRVGIMVTKTMLVGVNPVITGLRRVAHAAPACGLRQRRVTRSAPS